MKVEQIEEPQYRLTLTLSEAVSTLVLWRKGYNGIGEYRAQYEIGMRELLAAMPEEIHERILDLDNTIGYTEDIVKRIMA